MKTLLPSAALLLALLAASAFAQTTAPLSDLPSTPEPAGLVLSPSLLHPALHGTAQNTPATQPAAQPDDHTQPLDCSAISSSSYRVPAKLNAAQQRDLDRYFFFLLHKVRDAWVKSMPLAAQAGPFQKQGDVGI